MIAQSEKLLYLARHGQTDWNIQKRWQSWTDNPLNQTGIKQAKMLAHVFEGQIKDRCAIVSSPLIRATATAKLIQDALAGSSLELLSDLKEMDLGDYEGRSEAQLEDKLGTAAYQNWRLERWHQGAPGGESGVHFNARIKKVLEYICTIEEKVVLIVAHQGVNTCIANYLLKQTLLPQSHTQIWQMELLIENSKGLLEGRNYHSIEVSSKV